MSLFDVSISDEVEVTDEVDREPDRIDVLIQDVIAVHDVVVEPRLPAITSISPGHIRALDTVTISGQGFATSIGSNRVTMNGQTATILSAAEDQLIVTAPALLGLFGNGHAVVEVETPPLSAVKARGFVWAKADPVDALADYAIPLQNPQVNEQVGSDLPRVVEAEDWNRLGTFIDHFAGGGAEQQDGGFKSRDGVGIVGTPLLNPPNAPSLGGESLYVDPSQPGLLSLGWQLDDTLSFGGAFQAANSGPAFLRANATPDGILNLVEVDHIAMLNGTIDLVWFLVKSTGADFITSTDVLVNGASQFFDGTNFVNDQVASFRVNIPVLKGNRIQLRVDKSGLTSIVRVVGGVRVRYR